MSDYESFEDCEKEPEFEDAESPIELIKIVTIGTVQFTLGTVAFLALIYFTLGFGTWKPL